VGSLLKTLPAVLFIAFVLVSGTSSSIFAVWSCETFQLDSIANPPTEMAFLSDDMSIICDYSNDEYSHVRFLAYFFIAVWPVGVPLVFFLVLLRSRRAILQGRTTRLALSTSFLHGDYNRHWWWEVLLILQRLLVVGFVQWIPRSLLSIRMLCGTLVSLGYLVLLLFEKPHKRDDVGLMAFAVQTCVVLIFCMAQWIMIFKMVDNVASDLTHRILGFDSIDQLVATVIVINLTFLVVMVLSTLYHLLVYRDVTVLKLARSGEPPELSLKTGLRWHSFLSHTWASGQDQAANIKRKLQLLIPGCKLFLDVDDLEDVSDVHWHVTSSQSVLVFLSKGYFFSENCLHELDWAAASRTRMILVHEIDNRKGGAPLDTLRADCASQGHTLLAEADERSIIAWHRLAEAQLLSLRMIAQAMLHCMPGFEILNDPPDVVVPGELTLHNIEFRGLVRLFVSAHNPGASRLAKELSAALDDKRLHLQFEAPPGLQTHKLSFSEVFAYARDSRLRRSRSSKAWSVRDSKSGRQSVHAHPESNSYRGEVESTFSSENTAQPAGALAASFTPRPLPARRCTWSPAESPQLSPMWSVRRLSQTTTGRRCSRGFFGAANGSFRADILQGEACIQQPLPARRWTWSPLSKGAGSPASARKQSSSIDSVASGFFKTLKQKNTDLVDMGDVTHVLLYLNNATFVGEAGQALAHQVKQWRTAGLDLLLVHEHDEKLGGCPFEVLFQTTPNDLVAAGIYNKIALSCYSGAHRSVSLTQMATALGAVRKRSKLRSAALKNAVALKNAPSKLQSCATGKALGVYGCATAVANIGPGSRRHSDLVMTVSSASRRCSAPTFGIDPRHCGRRRPSLVSSRWQHLRKMSLTTLRKKSSEEEDEPDPNLTSCSV